MQSSSLELTHRGFYTRRILNNPILAPNLDTGYDLRTLEPRAMRTRISTKGSIQRFAQDPQLKLYSSNFHTRVKHKANEEYKT